jgi:hypothetical protein
MIGRLLCWLGFHDYIKPSHDYRFCWRRDCKKEQIWQFTYSPDLYRMRGRWVDILLLLAVLFLPTSAVAQTIDIGSDVGRVYNVADGLYVSAVSPSLTLSFRDIFVSSTNYFEQGSRWFEHDLLWGWEKSRGRVTFSATGGYFIWRYGIRDWSGSVGIRVRVRQ